MTLRGFGFLLDIQTGQIRQWYVGADGIKRWVHNDQPVEQTKSLQDAKT